MKILMVVMLLIVGTVADACNANCLQYSSSGSSTQCPSCPCTTSPLKVNVTQFTSLYSDWHGSCLDCIANKWNQGNAHAVGYEPIQNIWAIGLFRLRQEYCPNSDLCNPKIAVGCAHSIWQSSGWAQWVVDIGSFGCSSVCLNNPQQS